MSDSNEPVQLRSVWMTVGLAILINMLDGFDILSMSFAVNGIKAQWQLSEQSLGWLLSMGLIGMALGSWLNGWWADRLGRRVLLLVNVAWVGIGMAGCALAPNFEVLLVIRVITGFGIGGIIANGAVWVSESVDDQLRSTALAAYATGYSLGAALGGALAVPLIKSMGWPAVFYIGSIASALLWPLLWWLLPESPLYQKTPFADFSLASQTPSNTKKPSFFAEALNVQTILLWLMFFLTMSGFYFLASWIPRLMTLAGLSAQQGLSGGVILSMGGIIGSGCYAFITYRLNAQSSLNASLAGSALGVILLGAYMQPGVSDLNWVWVGALLIGIIINAAMAGLYAVGPVFFAPAIRATGMGATIGIGRLGAISAPIVAGWCLDQGITAPTLLQWSAVVFAGASLIGVWLRLWSDKATFAFDEKI
jgi:MFS family permease